MSQIISFYRLKEFCVTYFPHRVKLFQVCLHQELSCFTISLLLIKAVRVACRSAFFHFLFCLHPCPTVKNEICKNCELNSRPAARLETQYLPHHVLFCCYSLLLIKEVRVACHSAFFHFLFCPQPCPAVKNEICKNC
jgi:hypothetical protein